MAALRATALSPRCGYDTVAEFFDAWKWQPFWTRNELPRVESLLRRAAPPTIALDLGTGTGRYGSLLRELGAQHAIGVDLSRGMLRVANRRRNSMDLIQADIRALPFASERADLAIAARSLCHLAELDVALREISRVLRRHATLLVTELDPEHLFELTRVPTPGGDIYIDTWKRSDVELTAAAARQGLHVTEVLRVNATDCYWLPPLDEISSIDRTAKRPIFFIATFVKEG